MGVGVPRARDGDDDPAFVVEARRRPARVNGPRRPESPYNNVMTSEPAEVLAERLRTAFDLCELGESIRRAQLRREHPGGTEDEIEARLVAWLRTRPGAEHGDAWGRPITWPPSAR